MPVATKISPFNSHESWVISDDPIFLQHCAAQGFTTRLLSQIDSLPAQSIIFSFCNEAAKRTFDIAKNTPVQQSIFCATHVFEPSVNNALYSLNLIMNSDFHAALYKQRLVLTLLETHTHFKLEGASSEASVVISEQSTPYAMLEEDINKPYIHSVAEFFEVHYAHMHASAPCPFNFEGHLIITGILTVLRKPLTPPDKELKMALLTLIQEVAQHTALLTIKHNCITSFTVNSIEYRSLLKRAAGARALALTEFAVGVNEAIEPLIDYRFNSQMNEGINGVHVAIGDGSTGYHIDFLSPTVAFSPYQK